jgi:hypothetical protein
VDEDLHLIIRLSDDGKAYATSPQAPGLVYGRPSLKELRYDLDEVLAFHFERPVPFNVVEHIERHYDLADGELVLRVAIDAHTKEREEVAHRLVQIASLPGQAQALTASANPIGEAVYVCAIPSDTLGWLAAQLQPSVPGDVVNAALTIADGFLFTIPLASDDGTHPTWIVSSASAATSLSEIMQKTPMVTPQTLVSLQPC